jgi:hypothetical protein
MAYIGSPSCNQRPVAPLDHVDTLPVEIRPGGSRGGAANLEEYKKLERGFVW